MLGGQAKKTYDSPRLSEMYWEKGSNITKKFSAGSPLQPEQEVGERPQSWAH